MLVQQQQQQHNELYFSSIPLPDFKTQKTQTDINKKIATNFFHAVTCDKDLNAALSYVSDDYEENTMEAVEGTTGKEKLASIIEWLKTKPSDYKIKQIIADEFNQVAIVTHVILSPGEEMDIIERFLIKDGKIKSHWDITENSITLAKATPIAMNPPILKEERETQAEINKKTVIKFFEAVTKTRNYNEAIQYVSDDYVDHTHEVKGNSGKQKLVFLIDKLKDFPFEYRINQVVADKFDQVGIVTHAALKAQERDTIEWFSLNNGKIKERLNIIEEKEPMHTAAY